MNLAYSSPALGNMHLLESSQAEFSVSRRRRAALVSNHSETGSQAPDGGARQRPN